MKKKLIFIFILTLSNIFAGDLDDGIESYSSIRTGNDLRGVTNTKYIVRKAKAARYSRNRNSKDVVISTDANGGLNLGGVNMIGSKTRNITIIQNIKGNVTKCI